LHLKKKQMKNCLAAMPAAAPLALRVFLRALLWLGLAGPALAQHFDVELRTDKGPVVGSRILTNFFGDAVGDAGLPIDAESGYRIFPAYFGDFPGGRYATANPGFQAFGGAFLLGEQIHFRALGSLRFWSPLSGKWEPAAAGVKLTLYGGIPPEVVLGYSSNPPAWADQYAYYQAGTRFERHGISGTLTALIDDVKAGGVFHSHLDWKIAAATGKPPVGAYMVALELWSPALVGGQPKYLASQPFHVIFEAGISPAEMQQAFAARISPPCEAQALNWSVAAASCTANVAQSASGTSVLANDAVAPATGSASFSCSKGSWSGPSNASCALPVPAACAAQALSWSVGTNSCTASAAATNSGSQALLRDSALPALGEANFACSDGVWGMPTIASCAVPPPPACSAQTLSWAVGAQSCAAVVPSTASGSAAVATDMLGPATGSASFACSDGSWSTPSSAQCAVPAPAACAAQAQTWVVGANSCTALVAATPSGGAAVAADQQQPATGTASFACSEGSWSAASKARCDVPPPAACAAQALSWSVGAESCQALLPGSPSGTQLQASDTVQPATGKALYVCSDGQWSAAREVSCALPPPKPSPPARSPTSPWAPAAQLPWDRAQR
jgi:hypothetical protein